MKACMIFSITLILLSFQVSAQPVVQQPAIGTLEVVAELQYNPGNITVSADNRIFISMHQFRPCPMRLAEIVPGKGLIPWPNTAWNAEPGSGPDVLNAVLGVQIDSKNRLWALDNGQGLPPKLLAFDVATGNLVYRHDFPKDVAEPGTFLNDLAVDGERGFVYIADIGGVCSPALVVVDINQNISWRIQGHSSLAPEDVDMVIEGKVMYLPDLQGKPHVARVAINPITLSADNETLYYGSMTGLHWWKLPTSLIRERVELSKLFAAIQLEGPKPVSDGASTDREGNHYFASVGHNAIDMLTKDGQLITLVSDPKICWPDALSFGGDNWLYIVANQLHRAPAFNGVEGAQLPYLILRVWTGKVGVPGR